MHGFISTLSLFGKVVVAINSKCKFHWLIIVVDEIGIRSVDNCYYHAKFSCQYADNYVCTINISVCIQKNLITQKNEKMTFVWLFFTMAICQHGFLETCSQFLNDNNYYVSMISLIIYAHYYLWVWAGVNYIFCNSWLYVVLCYKIVLL